jgi:hypothetical protein
MSEAKWGTPVLNYEGPPLNGGKAFKTDIVVVASSNQRAQTQHLDTHRTLRPENRTGLTFDEPDGYIVYWFDMTLAGFRIASEFLGGDRIEGFAPLITVWAVACYPNSTFERVIQMGKLFVVDADVATTDFVPADFHDRVHMFGEGEVFSAFRAALKQLTRGTGATVVR